MADEGMQITGKIQHIYSGTTGKLNLVLLDKNKNLINITYNGYDDVLVGYLNEEKHNLIHSSDSKYAQVDVTEKVSPERASYTGKGPIKILDDLDGLENKIEGTLSDDALLNDQDGMTLYLKERNGSVISVNYKKYDKKLAIIIVDELNEMRKSKKPVKVKLNITEKLDNSKVNYAGYGIVKIL